MLAFQDVAEFTLTSEGGYTYRDIHGEERSGVHVSPRHDIAASSRRVLARAGRRRTAASIGACFVTVGIATALAGLESTALFVGFVGVAVAAVVDRYAPDVVFERPDPVATVTKSSTPGMTEREFNRRLAVHGEREQYKKEEREKQQKRAERKAKTQGGGRY